LRGSMPISHYMLDATAEKLYIVAQISDRRSFLSYCVSGQMQEEDKILNFKFNAEKGIINTGNTDEIKCIMKKAMNGEKLVISFIGGSITQGCNSLLPTTCYAYLIYEWWKKTFPKAEFAYLNGGIGGTTSQFGVARVEEDVLADRPDFLIVEFSVNDDATDHFMETYEGLIRRILRSKKAPAVLILNNVFYDDGRNAQEQHAAIAKTYSIPCLSMKNTVYQEILEGNIQKRDITEDDLHPNDAGHALIAKLAIHFLEGVLTEIKKEISQDLPIENKTISQIPDAVTQNRYENSIRNQNNNSSPILNGFAADMTPQNDIREIFRHGWTADKKGSSITFELNASCIAVQYRKTISRPAPIAIAILDGDEKNAIILDANFQEDWGDSLHIDTVLEHEEEKMHTLEIRIEETHEGDKVPFYLTSVISSYKN